MSMHAGDSNVFVLLLVIPAQAGIPCKLRPKDTTLFMLSAAHDVFVLDSCLRRNDGGGFPAASKSL